MDAILLENIHIGWLKGVKNALKMGANIHFDGETPIIEAIKGGNYDIVKYLIENGSYINPFKHFMETEPLKLDINYDILDLLLEHLKGTTNYNYMVGDIFSDAIKKRDMKKINFLINKKVDISHQKLLDHL